MRSKLVTCFDLGLAYVFLLRTILKSPGWMPSTYARVDVSVMDLLTFEDYLFPKLGLVHLRLEILSLHQLWLWTH